MMYFHTVSVVEGTVPRGSVSGRSCPLLFYTRMLVAVSPTPSCFADLPDDVTAMILQYLLPEDVARLAAVDSRLRVRDFSNVRPLNRRLLAHSPTLQAATGNDTVWRRMAARMFFGGVRACLTLPSRGVTSYQSCCRCQSPPWPWGACRPSSTTHSALQVINLGWTSRGSAERCGARVICFSNFSSPCHCPSARRSLRAPCSRTRKTRKTSDVSLHPTQGTLALCVGVRRRNTDFVNDNCCSSWAGWAPGITALYCS